jgi:hypothetical protein
MQNANTWHAVGVDWSDRSYASANLAERYRQALDEWQPDEPRGGLF